MKNDFYPGMKVSLEGENGLVTQEFDLETKDSKSYGFILWDTETKDDIEHWSGLYGSFIQAGGTELDQDFQFTHINEEADQS